MYKILVIEPDKASRLTLQNLLSFMGYDEVAAANCQEALEIAATEHVDMILVNSLVPSAECQNMRELLFAAGVEPRVVAYADAIGTNNIAQHVDDYLESPYIASALNQKIRLAV
ncbi:hypothetical protein [Cerasicoccus maritimus]|uniref:hypothetical protein n=1 Tax=Cerasicoccus maritimus TaxID=490089 RepID=UPI002852CBEC|nr:hypothetical protein [Cerasicoccus maritimus]